MGSAPVGLHSARPGMLSALLDLNGDVHTIVDIARNFHRPQHEDEVAVNGCCCSLIGTTTLRVLTCSAIHFHSFQILGSANWRTKTPPMFRRIFGNLGGILKCLCIFSTSRGNSNGVPQNPGWVKVGLLHCTD